jgi:hypothetical protein
MVRKACLVITLIGFASDVQALAIRLASASDRVPPEIVYTAGSVSPLELNLQIANETQSESPPILLWQLGLHIRGGSGSVGGASFMDISLPEDSLFGSSSMPSTGNDLPASDIVVSDNDPSFAGVSIPLQAARNIIDLHFAFTHDAQGTFNLTMSGYDEADQDHSSFWIPSSDGFPMTTFDNMPSQTDPPAIELAIIHVIASTLAGDYNHNGVVDAADYTVWRDSLGRTGSALSADGNGDRIVDLKDYDLWKASFPTSGSGNASAAPAPEPTTLAIAVLALVLFILPTLRRPLCYTVR